MFGATTEAAEIAANLDLRGKQIVITGGNAGIGLETTKVLMAAGATVIVGARNIRMDIDSVV